MNVTVWDILAIVLPLASAVIVSVAWYSYQKTDDLEKRAYMFLAGIVAFTALFLSASNAVYRDWGPQPKPMTDEERCFKYPTFCHVYEDVDIQQEIDRLFREVREGR